MWYTNIYSNIIVYQKYYKSYKLELMEGLDAKSAFFVTKASITTSILFRKMNLDGPGNKVW